METMVRSCCAVGCSNVYRKGSGICFYRLPSDPERKAKWIAAVKRENCQWAPSEHTWICSQHFVTGEKSNNPLAPNYVRVLLYSNNIDTKRRLEVDMDKLRLHSKNVELSSSLVCQVVGLQVHAV